MSLTGTFQTMGLPDLLQWMHGSRKTGTLVVRADRFARRIYFAEGILVSSASEDPTEYLGQFLLSHGAISEEDLQRAMETQKETGVLLGKILVMVGTVTEAQLQRYLEMKAEETVFSLFLLEDAHFEFLEGELPPRNLVPIRLSIDDILLRGLSRYDELQQIRDVFGTTLTVVGRNGQGPGPEFLGHPRRRAIWEKIDGQRSIADIALELHMADFLACETLHLLLQMGHVTVLRRVAAASPRPPVTSDAVEASRRLQEEGKHEEALDVLERAAVEQPAAAAALRVALKQAQEAFVGRTYRYHLPADRVPVLRRELESLTEEGLSPQEGFLISRINGAWTVRDVVAIAPFSEVDALRTLKRLRQREIIDLQ